MNNEVEELRKMWRERINKTFDETLEEMGMIGPFELSVDPDFASRHVVCKTADGETFVIYIRFPDKRVEEDTHIQVWVANINAPCSNAFFQF